MLIYVLCCQKVAAGGARGAWRQVKAEDWKSFDTEIQRYRGTEAPRKTELGLLKNMVFTGTLQVVTRFLSVSGTALQGGGYTETWLLARECLDERAELS
jgi:hypothetical protein